MGSWVQGLEGRERSAYEDPCFSSNPQVAIARYSGWQIAYILWGKCHPRTHGAQHMFSGHLQSPSCEERHGKAGEAARASNFEESGEW